MSQQLVVANRLTDGVVVYLTTEGDWSKSIEHGHVASSDADAEALLGIATRAARDQFVVDPYLIDTKEDGGSRRPTRLRERIRAAGPTVRRDLNRQAAPGH